VKLGAFALVGALAAGAAAGGGATALMSSGARESIAIARGDSLQIRFSIKTDTVLKVVGSKVVAAACGSSFLYLRTWRGLEQLSADTVSVTVQCAPSRDSVASVDVCFIPTDSALKYHIDASKSLDSVTLAFVQPWCKKADTLPAPDAPAKTSTMERRA
jgi:hypothetical protein